MRAPRIRQIRALQYPPTLHGFSQIEVTFNVDANGVLNVSASDKTTGKSTVITIANDQGHPSREEIERMVNEAEKYKADDEAASARIGPESGLEQEHEGEKKGGKGR